MQPLAQERIGLAQHARSGVGLDALDRGFRRQSGHHRFFKFMKPAAVVGEHPIGFEHLAMLAALDHLAMFEQLVEVGAQRFDGGGEVLQLLGDIVGDIVGNNDTRFMQHHVPQRNAVAQCSAFQMHRAARGKVIARTRQLAGGDHLGEHHGGGL
jgi:hypothetical protein